MLELLTGLSYILHLQTQPSYWSSSNLTAKTKLNPPNHMPPTTYVIAASDLEERLATWREIANLFRDRHEYALINGRTILAASINFGANAVETCIRDVEELLREARGESSTEDGELQG